MHDYYAFLASWAPTHIETFLFYAIAFLSIPLAYGVLFDPRIIRCGFSLIGVFGMISGIFLLLQAQFLAMAQLMIYAVGITLVVVIALMLTNPRMDNDRSPSLPAHRLSAIVVGIIVFFTIYLGLRSESWNIAQISGQPGEAVTTIGMSLLTYYSMPFEFASVLLLVALVGAIMLAKADRGTTAEEWLADENERSHEVAQV